MSKKTLKFKKDDLVPLSWYQLEFHKEGKSLKDYPGFTFTFMHDCEARLVKDTYYIRPLQECKGYFLVRNIDNANLCFRVNIKHVPFYGSLRRAIKGKQY